MSELSAFKGNPIEIGNQYESRISDSSGRTYEVTGFVNVLGKDLINFKGVDIRCKATWTKIQVEIWIKEGRMKLVGKNLLAGI